MIHHPSLNGCRIHTMDDRMIENMTPCEKLCFMILDQQRRLEDQQQRLEDQMTRLIDYVERSDRWVIYNLVVSSTQNTCLLSNAAMNGMYRVESLVNNILCKISAARAREILKSLFGRFSEVIDIVFDVKTYTNGREYMCISGTSFNFNGIRAHIGDNMRYNECIHHIALHQLPLNIWKLLNAEEINAFRTYHT